VCQYTQKHAESQDEGNHKHGRFDRLSRTPERAAVLRVSVKRRENRQISVNFDAVFQKLGLT
jgi:hypothetical protein